VSFAGKRSRSRFSSKTIFFMLTPAAYVR
jgi:hypothetical protein